VTFTRLSHPGMKSSAVLGLKTPGFTLSPVRLATFQANTAVAVCPHGHALAARATSRKDASTPRRACSTLPSSSSMVRSTLEATLATLGPLRSVDSTTGVRDLPDGLVDHRRLDTPLQRSNKIPATLRRNLHRAATRYTRRQRSSADKCCVRSQRGGGGADGAGNMHQREKATSEATSYDLRLGVITCCCTRKPAIEA
jgi:hypothetical protein